MLSFLSSTMDFPLAGNIYEAASLNPFFHLADVGLRTKLESQLQVHSDSNELTDEGTIRSRSPPNDNTHELQVNRTEVNVAIDESYCHTENGQQKWKCNLCPKVYTTKHNLVTHVLGHVGVRPYTCSLCDKSFKQLGHLNAHKQTHDVNKSHQCPICKRSFLRLIYVKRHMITHANRKAFMCHMCPEGFNLQMDLDSHLANHKLGVNNNGQSKRASLQCQLCGRIFLYPSQMKDHMLSHAQLRQYRCEVCGMRFIKDHHLKAHLLTHTAERPHKCPVCRRGFTLKGNMIRHTLIHSAERSFACQVCGKKFSQPQTLKMHMVVHAQQKPYSCDVCGKALARAHNLRSHMALHRNSKPFQCGLCGSAFTMKGNLQRHLKEKHKDAYVAEKKNDQLLFAQNEEPVAEERLILAHVTGHSVEDVLRGVGNNEFDTDETGSKKRKTLPKKLMQKKNNKKGRHSKNEEIHQMDFSNSMLAENKYFVNAYENQTVDIHGRVRALHNAIDDLAGRCGPPADKVTAIHSAIDEIAASQSSEHSQH